MFEIKKLCGNVETIAWKNCILKMLYKKKHSTRSLLHLMNYYNIILKLFFTFNYLLLCLKELNIEFHYTFLTTIKMKLFIKWSKEIVPPIYTILVIHKQTQLLKTVVTDLSSSIDSKTFSMWWNHSLATAILVHFAVQRVSITTAIEWGWCFYIGLVYQEFSNLI